jgi:aspartate/methionine/tyrosine aminotransferase
VFPQVPQRGGTGSEFVARAIDDELLIIPGGIFSRRDTHFRISYAASDETIERGLKVLARLMEPGD